VGSREALAFQGRRWTFAEMHARVDAVAQGLLSLGIAPGDKVALWMVNRPEWIDAMFAIMKIGAVLVPVNTRFRTEDMAYISVSRTPPRCSSPTAPGRSTISP